MAVSISPVVSAGTTYNLTTTALDSFFFGPFSLEYILTNSTNLSASTMAPSPLPTPSTLSETYGEEEEVEQSNVRGFIDGPPVAVSSPVTQERSVMTPTEATQSGSASTPTPTPATTQPAVAATPPRRFGFEPEQILLNDVRYPSKAEALRNLWLTLPLSNRKQIRQAFTARTGQPISKTTVNKVFHQISNMAARNVTPFTPTPELTQNNTFDMVMRSNDGRVVITGRVQLTPGTPVVNTNVAVSSTM